MYLKNKLFHVIIPKTILDNIYHLITFNMNRYYYYYYDYYYMMMMMMMMRMMMMIIIIIIIIPRRLCLWLKNHLSHACIYKAQIHHQISIIAHKHNSMDILVPAVCRIWRELSVTLVTERQD